MFKVDAFLHDAWHHIRGMFFPNSLARSIPRAGACDHLLVIVAVFFMMTEEPNNSKARTAI